MCLKRSCVSIAGLFLALQYFSGMLLASQYCVQFQNEEAATPRINEVIQGCFFVWLLNKFLFWLCWSSLRHTGFLRLQRVGLLLLQVMGSKAHRLRSCGARAHWPRSTCDVRSLPETEPVS